MIGDWQRGEVAPWFGAATLRGTNEFSFDSTAGRHVVMLFSGSASHEASAAAIRLMLSRRDLFDDERACFFGVSIDPADVSGERIAKMLPGIRWFLDFDWKVSRLYRAAGDQNSYRPFWLLLDPALRVIARAPIAEGAALLDRLAAILNAPMPDIHAPVLIVPDVFEPEFCRRLIDLYEERGGGPSGFMRDVGGKTTSLLDDSFKRRSDVNLAADDPLRRAIGDRLLRTVVPMMERAFQFNATRVERYLIACYDAEGGGYFRAHRDNTTAGTAHRRFACTINLNSEEFEGGELIFPEYGPRRYRAPTGGAVVFSCSLLHEALPVTRGKRYAYLPFFYDESAAQIREKMAKSGAVAANLTSYRAAPEALPVPQPSS